LSRKKINSVRIKEKFLNLEKSLSVRQ